jgi:DNA replication and repair protein RecF
MYLRYLRVRRFRNLAPIDITLEPGAHLLFGRNAQGKTNFLEAVYHLLSGSTFRNVALRDLVQWDQPHFFVGGRLALGKETSRTIKSSYFPASSQRRILIDDQVVSVRRLRDLAHAVFLSHEDLNLVSGSPSLRRNWMDRLLTLTVPEAGGLVYRYTRAVRQRNLVLQQSGGRADTALVQSWTEPWLNLGAALMRQHARLIDQFSPIAAGHYQRLSGQDEPLHLQYQPGWKAELGQSPGPDADESDWREALKVALEIERPAEQRRGFTLVGPHTDEVQLLLGASPVQRFGSQGQQRTTALALRLAEIDWVRAVFGQEPIILADEIFGELDEERRLRVWDVLRSAEQLWLTAAKGSGLEHFGTFERRFVLENGHCSNLIA